MIKVSRAFIPLITFLFLPFNAAKPQVNASFTMNIQAGCSPLKVSFINQSTGPDTLTYMWYLGVQQGTSTLKDPQATYVLPGAYDVKLVVKHDTEKDSVTKTIVVFRNPVARFTSARLGCSPFEVQFTDLSIEGDGQITSWKWDFRTGETDTSQNPVKTFYSPGQYDIFLEVTDVFGCKNSIDTLKYIDVVNPPAANFSISPASACQVPATFTFNDLSAVQGTVSYDWDFGDGTRSQAQNPVKTYTDFNDYPVKLTVTSDHGCSDDTLKTAYVSGVTASGILRQNGRTISANDTICNGMIDFSNASTGTDFVRWDFGDGVTTASKFGFHQYVVSKAYVVTLIGSLGTICADTFQWNLYVEDLKADFEMSSDFSCMSPAMVSFTDNSVNAVKWEWTFYDNEKAFTQNPVHTFYLPNDTDEYLINEAVSFVTSLEVESPGGCKSSIQKTLIIKKPTALFSVDKVEGCIPLTVTFNDRSLSDLSITNREWIFSDSEKYSGTVDSAVFTYGTYGSFPSKLVVTNSAGCIDTSYVIMINAGKKLLPDFILSSDNVCQNEEITLFNNTPESWLIQSWHYQVGGVDIGALPNEPNPQWIMHADTGFLDVKLEVSSNGCISDTIKTHAIYNKGPLAFYTCTFDCDIPYDYAFTNRSQGLETFQWRFGDDSVNTTTVNPDHTYMTDGNYTVVLDVTKGSCSDSYQRILPVRMPQAIIHVDTMACAQSTLSLSGKESYDMVDYCYERYLWDFGDSTPGIRTNLDTIRHVYQNRGNYQIKLTTGFDNGCFDSASTTVNVYQPYAGFVADTLLGCSPFIVNFTDTSRSDVHPVENWHWTFEPGKDSIYSSKIPVISHWFNHPGIFEVTLLITDTLGCVGGASTIISTANPDAEFFTGNPQACAGDAVLLYYTPQSIDSLIWSFDDGAVSRDDTRPVSHVYLNAGVFAPSLTIYRFGCSDSFTLQNPVDVQLASAYFAVSDSFWNCYPYEITFTHQAEEQDIISGVWNFGYGNTPPSEYAEIKKFNYPRPGIYTVSLDILTSFGCTDTFMRNIEISGPVGDFTASKHNACRFDEITYIIRDTSNVFDFEWDMADGTTFLKGDTITHMYHEVGTFYPKLLLYGDSGNCKPPAVVDTVHIYEVVASFEIPDTGLCSNYDIILENSSAGNDINSWNINDSIFTSEMNPLLNLDEGTYLVSLMVRNEIGCSDTTEQSITVRPLPAIDLMEDTLICEGDEIIIRITGGDEIAWSPAAGLSSVNSYSPSASPDVTTTYIAIVRDSETGCRNLDDIRIYVQQFPEITLHPTDTTIVIGEIVSVSADSLGDVTYLWTMVPTDELMSCLNCTSPVIRPLLNTYYTLEVADTNHCFNEKFYLNVGVDEKYSLDLPAAFRPTGEEENTVVYVKGWGIRRLVEFRIYNRYGNEVFYTDDLNQGWDGTYKGKLQNIDSYAYTVTAEMWNGQMMMKKGTVTLLR
ncbi:MAG TPA: PKD domain-containing protein [Bacteroidales bacterium]|nr:PKD domain-containing protein [Bacteroidales bacterium]